MNIIDHISQELHSYINQQFSAELVNTKLPILDISLNIDPSRQQFGDVTTNAALILAKIVGKSPRAVAEHITSHFTHPAIEKIEIAGPGFVNMHLTLAALIQLSQELSTEKIAFYSIPATESKKYNIEFVSANPTGPLHIGHGRGGIIGDVLGNVLASIGHHVTKEFYINDAGSQIQKLGASFKIRCLQKAGITAELPEDSYHGEYLIELAEKCLNEYGVDVLNNDDAFFALYAKDNLLEALRTTLKNYGIMFDNWFSEATLHKKQGDSSAIDVALSLLDKRGYLFEAEGATWFQSTAFGDDKDRVVQKNTGEMTYVAADVAYLENKISRGNDKLIMILGQDHHSYLMRLKAVLQGLGRNPDMLDVILYQLVTLTQDGNAVRMSKRAGRMVTLDDIIETVGTDVARFFYLNKKADAHLEFNIDLALKQTDENPVYYIQYAYVRICSILQKASGFSEFADINQADSLFIGDTERLLVKKLVHLRYLLHTIARNYQTHALTYYVIELAQLFHSYYNGNKVLDPMHINQSRGRLFTLMLVQQTFKTCFNILGISAPDRM